MVASSARMLVHVMHSTERGRSVHKRRFGGGAVAAGFSASSSLPEGSASGDEQARRRAKRINVELKSSWCEPGRVSRIQEVIT
jgi:hypothetical protein